jgi:thioester reductase-like protein
MPDSRVTHDSTHHRQEAKEIEPLTRTLPGPGGGYEQAVWQAERRVVDVVERVTVVRVVVKTVVKAQSGQNGTDGDFARRQVFEVRTR